MSNFVAECMICGNALDCFKNSHNVNQNIAFRSFALLTVFCLPVVSAGRKPKKAKKEEEDEEDEDEEEEEAEGEEDDGEEN